MVGGVEHQRGGGQDWRRDEIHRVRRGLLDLAALRVDRERVPRHNLLAPHRRPGRVEDGRLGFPLEDHHVRLAVDGDVQSELCPEVQHGRAGRGDDEPLRAAGDARPELTPAAVDPVDRQEFEVRRPLQRERHPAEQAQSHPARAEDEATGRQQVPFRWRLAFPRLPLGSRELDHDGESPREHQLGGGPREHSAPRRSPCRGDSPAGAARSCRPSGAPRPPRPTVARRGARGGGARLVDPGIPNRIRPGRPRPRMLARSRPAPDAGPSA